MTRTFEIVCFLACLSQIVAIQLRLPRVQLPRLQPTNPTTWETLEEVQTSTRQRDTSSSIREKSRLRTRVEDLIPSSRKLKAYQRAAAPIATSFEASSEFSPMPLLSDRHVQTILGYLVRDIPESAYVVNNNLLPFVREAGLQSIQNMIAPARNDQRFWDERQRISTPDGDWFHADYKASQVDQPTGLVLLVHGLEANSESALSVDIAKSYCDMGLDVVCLNFRGCSGEPNDTLGGYHVGFTRDLRHFLNLLRVSLDELPPIYLSGFSLGGNVVLKTLGELGVGAVDKYNIKGAAVACPPFDLERDNQFLDAPGFNRAAYSEGLLRKFREKVQYQLDTLCDGDESTGRFDYAGAMAAQTIQEFDNSFLAPVYGFKDNLDYYRKSSSRYFLEKITVPTVVIRAADDPFFDPDAIPWDLTAEHGGRAPVKIILTEHGGHLGFAFQQDTGKHQPQPKAAWLPTQLSGFLEHVQNHSP